MAEYNQIPIGFGIQPLKPEDVKVERNRFVKFVKKDGKLIKVWVCATCKCIFIYNLVYFYVNLVLVNLELF